MLFNDLIWIFIFLLSPETLYPSVFHWIDFYCRCSIRQLLNDAAIMKFRVSIQFALLKPQKKIFSMRGDKSTKKQFLLNKQVQTGDSYLCTKSLYAI